MDKWIKKQIAMEYHMDEDLCIHSPKLHIDYMCIRQDVFCDYMQYLLFITTSHICILLSVYVSPCNIVPS